MLLLKNVEHKLNERFFFLRLRGLLHHIYCEVQAINKTEKFSQMNCVEGAVEINRG